MSCILSAAFYLSLSLCPSDKEMENIVRKIQHEDPLQNCKKDENDRYICDFKNLNEKEDKNYNTYINNSTCNSVKII